ncbi:MAG: PhoU domain-containing protein [Paracoccaceae bacterium]
MEHEHIRSAFDRDLEAIQAHLMRLGELSATALHDATLALINRDMALAERVRKGDKALDEIDELINDETAKLIALRAPAASDMRMALGAMKISNSLERVGITRKHRQAQRGRLGRPGASATPPARCAGCRTSCSACSMTCSRPISSVTRRWPMSCARDEDVDQIYNVLFRTLLTHMMEDPKTITSVMHLHFIAKNLERIGDHITAIAEQIIYQVEGRRPDEERPRSDTTSSISGTEG